MATDWAHGLQLESLKCLTLKGGDNNTSKINTPHHNIPVFEDTKKHIFLRRLSGGITKLKKKL